ncbi:concanavalin A-like lectin/glucanase domain-containing protein, partial [Butyriboletus roseoflavus]
MLFNVALFSSLLLSPVVLAVPFGIGARIARRGVSSQGNNRLERAIGVGSNILYSSDYAGAILTSGNTGTFSAITGDFTVPKFSGSNGSSAQIWLTIDGITCPNIMLGAGIALTVGDSGTSYYGKVVLNHTFTHTSLFPSRTAFYKRAPDQIPQAFPDSFNISAGDTLSINVTASSPTSGTVTIENQTNGQVASKDLTSSTPLCGQDMGWGVSDPRLNGSLVPLADFGTVVFKNAMGNGVSGFSPSNATIVNMLQNNTVLANATTSETSVTIKYL